MKYPTHLGVIPDGNRRWSKLNNVDYKVGYIKGIDTLERITKWALYTTPIEYLTVYGLSTENVMRAGPELNTLFDLYENQFLKISEDQEIHDNKVNLRVIGLTELLPEGVQKAIAHAEERTKDYSNKHLMIALCYGGREELIRAVKQIAQKVSSGLDIEKIDEHLIKENLYTNGTPYPELIIRTAEKRLSNFLTWQSAYSELAFVDKLFPDLTVDDVKAELTDFSQREQRFGI